MRAVSIQVSYLTKGDQRCKMRAVSIKVSYLTKKQTSDDEV